MITNLISEFLVFLLDDGILGGPEKHVLQDLEFVEREAPILGLQLNHVKIELICKDTAGSLLLKSALICAKCHTKMVTSEGDSPPKGI